MIKIVDDNLDTILEKSFLKKPHRHVIVAYRTPVKKVLDAIRSELSKREKQYILFNVSHGAYIFVLSNMSTIEVVDKDIYNSDHHSHLVTKEGDQSADYRVFPFCRLV